VLDVLDLIGEICACDKASRPLSRASVHPRQMRTADGLLSAFFGSYDGVMIVAL
jgi:hypothetical protein